MDSRNLLYQHFPLLLDVSCDPAWHGFSRQPQFISLLEVHPELSRRVEEHGQAHCRIAGDPAPFLDNSCDPIRRNAECFSQRIGVQRRFRRFHEFLKQDLPWMYRSHTVLYHVIFSLDDNLRFRPHEARPLSIESKSATGH